MELNHPEEETNKISIESLHSNMNQIDISRTFLCIIGGLITGVLKCTGIQGLISFLILYITITLLLGIKIKFDFKQYMNCTMLIFLTSDLQKNILSFILFWTLTYALVYIY